MNATCERLIGTLRRELLDRMLILSQAHLRTVLTEYLAHCNSARPHQGIDQRVPDRAHEEPRTTAASPDPQRIRRKPVLSGLINEYTREPPDKRRDTDLQPNPIFERHSTGCGRRSCAASTWSTPSRWRTKVLPSADLRTCTLTSAGDQLVASAILPAATWEEPWTFSRSPAKAWLGRSR